MGWIGDRVKCYELPTWRGSAAYLYTLRLDPVCLAWEYLRRNALYRATWATQSPRAIAPATSWGLKSWEDPGRDARSAEPIWWPTPVSSVVLTPSSVGDAAPTFKLWCIPGRKSLMHDGRGLRVTATHPLGVTRAVLDPDLAADRPYGYQMSAGASLDVRCRAVKAFDASYGSAEGAQSSIRFRPTRSALIHARILQSLDGADAGASHRDIAEALFGSEAVIADWSPDSEIRAQVRYLLKRGRALAAGGYRSLLNLDSS
jgi:hypothetical protein